MDVKKARNVDISMKQVLEYYYRREEQLRLAWFRKNEDRLMDFANKKIPESHTKELKEKLGQHRKERFENAQKFVVQPYDEDKPMSFDINLAARNIMRPVDPEVTRLLYKGTEKEGRANYLHQRVKIIPEKRFYYPETTSFEYGWKMWDNAKEIRDSRFGRQQVIRDSFYRRRGVGRDPDWYREPAKLSPTVCGIL